MIRKKVPDKKKAKSLVEAAEKDMAFIMSVPPSESAATTIIRSIYEDFRMLGEALLTAEGLEATGPDHHTQMIDKLLGLKISTTRPLLLLNELKRIRHYINYQGYRPTKLELENVLSIADTLWGPVLNDVKRKIV